MSRILFYLILIGIAVWYYRKWTTPKGRSPSGTSSGSSRTPARDEVTTLVKDPKTGEYRVARDDEKP
ncbi:hypothetical protein NAC44_02975 [Allorhizobium sp. BGMRC 0089]|uniref:hypothetical protein n=1 Tax=Allorhizobium sonneratiae TaxID=2934936 RepID=UPI002033FF91|nr:hypothetical protein [Allorhizobium sonneratiae]MCM2291290.1 hypothetical protein [Allorhizobium sonneratiae]